MKKILITGAARGLGASLRKFLIKKDCFVYGTTRYVEGVRNSKSCEFHFLDLTNKESIERFARDFINSKKTIDAIVHNAGVAYLGPADVLAEDEKRYMFDVNFFGPIYLTELLLPLLKKRPKSSLIFISSILSHDPWPYLGTYAASKAALEAVAFEWAVLLRKWKINVSVIQPNPLPTDMQILRSKNASSSPYPTPVQRDLKWESIEDTCELVLRILKESSPQFRYQTGVHSIGTIQRLFKPNALEKLLAKHRDEHTF